MEYVSRRISVGLSRIYTVKITTEHHQLSVEGKTSIVFVSDIYQHGVTHECDHADTQDNTKVQTDNLWLLSQLWKQIHIKVFKLLETVLVNLLAINLKRILFP